jgi:hypothetical protein
MVFLFIRLVCGDRVRIGRYCGERGFILDSLIWWNGLSQKRVTLLRGIRGWPGDEVAIIPSRPSSPAVPPLSTFSMRSLCRCIVVQCSSNLLQATIWFQLGTQMWRVGPHGGRTKFPIDIKGRPKSHKGQIKSIKCEASSV